MGDRLLQIADLLSLPVLIILAMVGLFEGVRRLRLGARKRSAIASAIICGGLLLAISAVEFWIALRRPASFLASAPMPDVRPDRFANVPIDQREKTSRLYALFVFTNYGILVNHYDAAGQWRILVPTQQEISDRDALLHLDWLVSKTRQNAIVGGMIPLLAALIAAFFGWRSAYLQRHGDG
jgi:hypothetical protein